MITFKGYWTAEVEQEFEIEAESVEEFQQILADEMNPQFVTELQNFHYVVEEETEDDSD